MPSRPTNTLRALATGLLLLGLGVAPVFVGTARAQADARSRALDLLQESAVLYREGRFAEAATLLRRAHELHPSPPLLYNLGRALEGAEDPAGALEAYRAYLAAVGDDPAEAERRGEAEARIEALRAETVVPDPEPDRTEPPSPEPDGPRDDLSAHPAPGNASPLAAEAPTAAPRSVAPWVVLGAGVGTAVGGLVVGWRARDRQEVAEDPATSLARAVTLHERAERLAIAANALIVVGGVVAAAGLTWGLVGGRDRDGPTLGVGPGSLHLFGHF